MTKLHCHITNSRYAKYLTHTELNLLLFNGISKIILNKNNVLFKIKITL